MMSGVLSVAAIVVSTVVVVFNMPAGGVPAVT